MQQKTYRKIFNYSMLGLILVALLVFGFLAWQHEQLPEGIPGPEADSVALRMQQKLNLDQWENTRYIRWTFTGEHEYLWDKVEHKVLVQWGEYKVVLYTEKLLKSIAFKKEKKLSGAKRQKIIHKAWSFFCNDSFWLSAPFKVFDPGTERKLVDTEEAAHALLVTYESGGVTPGDSYMWLLDENYMPFAWKMWVKIIPIGGVKAEWLGWNETETGVILPSGHNISGYETRIDGLKTGNSIADMDMEDPFNPAE